MPHLYREGAIKEDAGAESSGFIEYVNQQKAAERLETSGKPDPELEEMCCGVAKAVARLGASDLLIAEALGIEASTLDDWRQTRSEFAHALQTGRDDIGRAIERALLRRAVGFSYPAEKVFCTRDGDVFETAPPKSSRRARMPPRFGFAPTARTSTDASRVSRTPTQRQKTWRHLGG
jgi:hypothetical protein